MKQLNNGRPMQSTSFKDSLPPRSRDSKHRSRSPQQITTAIIRNDDPETVLQPLETEMGATLEGRRLCSIPQPPAPAVLESSTRSICSEDRCIPTELAEERLVHESTMAPDPTSIAEIEGGQDKRGNPGDPILDNTVLVSNADAHESTGSSGRMANGPLELHRLALVSKKRKDLGMPEDLISHLNKATRDSTTRMYNASWKKYVDWCTTKHRDPTADNAKQILIFLHEFSHFSRSTLNGYRSSIASVLKVIHPTSPPLAEDPDIIAFFRAKRQCTINIPNLSSLETWDTDILARYILSQLLPSSLLSVYDLQQKLALLLCLHTMWRPRSDIGRLQFRDIIMRYSPINGTLAGAILHDDLTG
ncbi:hypothetical protein [Parasitella parasitica]|uniref:Core-binding (CB) domain-containing protein n=1 Tax=Parasitella parasitica TaxID=35722 RepID=A0A0B7NLM7_9FUNG|nr:hypothetical protein [Parasitella parasitica]